MKLLSKFYYLPFLIGAIISFLFWISGIDARLRVEGFAKIDVDHSMSDRVSQIYWKTSIKEILEKYNNQSVIILEKRNSLRFSSKNNDIEEIKKNYLNVKNEFKLYKKEYLEYMKSRIRLELESKKLSKKFKKKLNNGREYISNLSNREFLLDLKTNEVIIQNYQFIYITLLISFMLTIILYNIKKIF